MNAATHDDRALAHRLNAYKLDPLGFVRAVFPWGEGKLSDEPGPDGWQADVLTALGESLGQAQATNDAVRFAVASGHGVGKTALSAWLVLWFLSTRDHPQVVVTANTAAQLQNKTWRELAKWHRLAANKHWFGWTTDRFVFAESPETWFAAAVPAGPDPAAIDHHAIGPQPDDGFGDASRQLHGVEPAKAHGFDDLRSGGRSAARSTRWVACSTACSPATTNACRAKRRSRGSHRRPISPKSS